MVHIRKIPARVGALLLAQFVAPDFRTLVLRAILWVCATSFIFAGLLGLVWVYYTFGLAAMWVAVLGIILLAIQMERRAPVYYGDADWLGSDPALPPPGTPQIGRASTAIARRSSNTSPTVSGRQDNNSRPGRVARR
jgi:hypothetical protein